MLLFRHVNKDLQYQKNKKILYNQQKKNKKLNYKIQLEKVKKK